MEVTEATVTLPFHQELFSRVSKQSKTSLKFQARKGTRNFSDWWSVWCFWTLTWNPTQGANALDQSENRSLRSLPSDWLLRAVWSTFWSELWFRQSSCPWSPARRRRRRRWRRAGWRWRPWRPRAPSAAASVGSRARRGSWLSSSPPPWSRWLSVGLARRWVRSWWLLIVTLVRSKVIMKLLCIVGERSIDLNIALVFVSSRWYWCHFIPDWAKSSVTKNQGMEPGPKVIIVKLLMVFVMTMTVMAMERMLILHSVIQKMLITTRTMFNVWWSKKHLWRSQQQKWWRRRQPRRTWPGLLSVK